MSDTFLSPTAFSLRRKDARLAPKLIFDYIEWENTCIFIEGRANVLYNLLGIYPLPSLYYYVYYPSQTIPNQKYHFYNIGS